MIKFKRDELTREWNLLLGEDTFIHGTNDWKQLFNLLTGRAKYNWYKFSLIHFYFENDIICPGFEIEVALLGFGLRFRHNRSWDGTEIQARIDEIEEMITGEKATQEQETFLQDVQATQNGMGE